MFRLLQSLSIWLIFAFLIAACAVPAAGTVPEATALSPETALASAEATATPTAAAEEAGAETETATAEAGCPEATDGSQAVRNDAHGYCLLYPAGYEVRAQPASYSLAIWAPADTPGHRERLFINVEEAAGRTAEAAAGQMVDEYRAAGFELQVDSGLTVAGEPAEVLDGVPGQDLNRVVLFVHDDRLYRLMFLPADPEQAEAYRQMEDLYQAVLDTFTFVPAVAYVGEPLLIWQGETTFGGDGEATCQSLRLYPEGQARIGPCGAAEREIRLSAHQEQEWNEIVMLLGAFELETAAEQIHFQGMGQREGPAWQRALATWAEYTYGELATGRVSAAGRTVLSWWLGEVPEHPGYCHHLVVLAYGYAYINVDPCGGGGESLAHAETWLETAEWERFDSWLYSRAPAYQDDNYIDGRGTEEMSEGELAELAGWAEAVYARIQAHTPSYLGNESP